MKRRACEQHAIHSDGRTPHEDAFSANLEIILIVARVIVKKTKRGPHEGDPTRDFFATNSPTKLPPDALFKSWLQTSVHEVGTPQRGTQARDSLATHSHTGFPLETSSTFKPEKPNCDDKYSHSDDPPEAGTQ
eukprot:7815337-Pyramimonas_sp.AAC.1